MYELIRNIRFIEKLTSEGKACVMATIVKTEGSSYRKKWTQMVVAEDMSYEGALSGGCVEREVLRQSNKLFFTKGNSVFVYDGTETLGCKGRIWVALEYIQKDCMEPLISIVKAAHSQRTNLQQGITRKDPPCTFFKKDGEVFPLNKSVLEDLEGAETRLVSPQNRLVIIGGEFDSFILARTAQWVGFDTHLVVYKDFVKPPYKPDYHIVRCQPDQIEPAFNWDRSTSLVLMTHSMNRDFQYLTKVINQDLGFIGALGPSNRREELMTKCYSELKELTDNGRKNLDGLRGPVGLDIRARTPEEIAVSILAEIVREMNESSNK